MELLTHTKKQSLADFVIPEPLAVLEVPEGLGGFVFQQVPQSEVHNTVNPSSCWCIPRMWAYTDEEGKIDVIVTEHQYEM